VPESRAQDPAPLDLLAGALCLATVLPLVYTVQSVAESGWSAVRVPWSDSSVCMLGRDWQLRRSASSCNICTGQIMTHDEELCQP